MCCGDSKPSSSDLNASGCPGDWVKVVVLAVNSAGMLVLGGNYYGRFKIGDTVCVRSKDVVAGKVEII